MIISRGCVTNVILRNKNDNFKMLHVTIKCRTTKIITSRCHVEQNLMLWNVVRMLISSCYVEQMLQYHVTMLMSGYDM